MGVAGEPLNQLGRHPPTPVAPPAVPACRNHRQVRTYLRKRPKCGPWLKPEWVKSRQGPQQMAEEKTKAHKHPKEDPGSSSILFDCKPSPCLCCPATAKVNSEVQCHGPACHVICLFKDGDTSNAGRRALQASRSVQNTPPIPFVIELECASRCD
jgi:hypothetical protein